MLIKKINMNNTRWICMVQYTGVLRIIACLIQNYKVSSTYLSSTIRTFSFEDDLFGATTKIPMKTNYFQLTRLIKSYKSQVTHRSQVSCSSSLSYDKLVYTIQHSQNNLHLQHQNQSKEKAHNSFKWRIFTGLFFPSIWLWSYCLLEKKTTNLVGRMSWCIKKYVFFIWINRIKVK